MDILTGVMVILILCIVGWLLFVEVFRNTDITTNPNSKSFNSDVDLAVLVKDLVIAADDRVKAESVSGIGEQFVAIKAADDKILYLAKKLSEKARA